jgi:hypothetical protein
MEAPNAGLAGADGSPAGPFNYNGIIDFTVSPPAQAFENMEIPYRGVCVLRAKEVCDAKF